VKPLTVRFDMTGDDLTALFKAATVRDPYVRRVLRRRAWILAVYLVVADAFAAGVRLLEGRPNWILWLAVAAVLMLAVALWPTRRATERIGAKHARMILATPAGRAYAGPRTVQVGPDGLAVESEFGHSLVRWRGVFDLIPAADYVFLVLAGNGYLAIPRKAFEFDDDFRRFWEAVE
jgi:hypothetical protein